MRLEDQLKSIDSKVSHKMMMKLTPTVVNFTNFLRASFCQFPFAKKLQTQTVSTDKLRKTLSNEKDDRKIMLKLTPSVGCHLTSFVWTDRTEDGGKEMKKDESKKVKLF